MGGEPISSETKVVLVDDHRLFRGGLRQLLEESGVRVVGEARSGDEALRIVEELAPDVVVMDIQMPGMSGVEATRRIAVRAPRTRVVVLTVSADDADIMDAMVAGAAGYILKDAPVDEIVAGVRAAARGEASISPRVAARLLARLRATHAGSSPTLPADASLTEREVEVLRLLAAGKPNSEIAGELFISPKTVKNHIASILSKLQMENRIQAAVYAVRTGIV